MRRRNRPKNKAYKTTKYCPFAVHSTTASVKSSDYAERIQSGLRSADNFSAPFPWFLTIAGALEYEVPVVFSLLLPQFTIRHKTISIYKWNVKKSASVYDLLVHQYGGVVTVAKFLSRDWKPSIERPGVFLDKGVYFKFSSNSGFN